MDQVLQDSCSDEDEVDIFRRAQLFTATRSNQGLMLLDKEREELVQVNTPLSGLHELQAQAQEQMCAVSLTPAVILNGISPSGFNASSDGEIKVFYDRVAAYQEAFIRSPLDIILKVMQLSLFGEVDENIGFKFISLYQTPPLEESQIKLNNATAANTYLAAGVISPEEQRKRLADDPESGYEGLDLEQVPIAPPETAPEGETDPLDEVDGEQA